MKELKPKEFIRNVLINEIGELVTSHPYLSFILMANGIEFLGKCINSNTPIWNQIKHSRKDFENAIKTIPSLEKYKKYLGKPYRMYSSFRCGLAHALSPKVKITLSSGKEMEHLKEHNGRLNLKVEDFYKDFKEACEWLLKQDFSAEDKMNKIFLEVPDKQ